MHNGQKSLISNVKNLCYQRQIVSALRSIGVWAKFLHFVCIKCKHFFHAFFGFNLTLVKSLKFGIINKGKRTAMVWACVKSMRRQSFKNGNKL